MHPTMKILQELVSSEEDVPKFARLLSPEAIQELKTLSYTLGRELEPEDVLQVAGNPSSTLHSYFTWDDTEAATLYRLEEARHVVKKYKIRLLSSTIQETKVIRASFTNSNSPSTEPVIARKVSSPKNVLDIELNRIKEYSQPSTRCPERGVLQLQVDRVRRLQEKATSSRNGR